MSSSFKYVVQDLDLKELAFPSMFIKKTQTIYILLLTLYGKN